MRIGVIGGGLMGLALAERLGDLGNQVSVLERDQQLGGLTTHHDYGGFTWDRFYHVILPTDSNLIAFLSRIGLRDQLRWQTTKTGFYVDRTFHPLNNALDFLRFPLLSPWDKARLAGTLLYSARINDWRRLEKIPVEDWLVRISGRTTYEKLWRPLLLAKLGENYRRVSAVFIWSYIKRMFSARDSAARKEQLGYVSGGYRSVFARLEQRILTSGGSIELGNGVKEIRPEGSRIVVASDAGQRLFDKVIFTGPANVLRSVAAPSLLEVRGGEDVEYLGVLCMVLVTRVPLMPFYVLNIADDQIPFTGVIGMSNVVALEETAGRHITYVPRYLLSGTPELRAPEEEIRARFIAGIRRLFPTFDFDCVESIHINRAEKVQPLQVLDYSALIPRTATRNENFFVINTAQFVNSTLNNDSVIAAVNAFLDENGENFKPGPRSSHLPTGGLASSI